jgi:hypothetical protein
VPVERVYVLGNADLLDRNVNAGVPVEARDTLGMDDEHERRSRLLLGDEGSSLGTLNSTGRWLLSWTISAARRRAGPHAAALLLSRQERHCR